MIKVSIIIPVYNVELYLRECLDSIINQTLKEIEIICIDDCSTDKSYSILEEYSIKDNRVKIFRNKENMSAGPSRNIGIRESRGEYIAFVDSDDFIDKNYYELLYSTAKEYSSDIVNTSNILRYNNGELSYYYCNVYNFLTEEDKKKDLFIKFDSNITLDNFLLNDKSMFTTNPINKIYSRDFIIKNNLLFMENTKLGVSEDCDFVLRLLMHSPSISFNNDAIYYYRDTPNSTYNSQREDIKYGINAIEHLTHTVNYCRKYFPDLLNVLYDKVWQNPYYIFYFYNEENKRLYYPYLHNFANFLYTSQEFINKKELEEFKEYLLIKCCNTYNEYLLHKYILNNYKTEIEVLNNKIDALYSKINNDKSFRLFDIKVDDRYIIIVLFGLKIRFKK